MLNSGAEHVDGCTAVAYNVVLIADYLMLAAWCMDARVFKKNTYIHVCDCTLQHRLSASLTNNTFAYACC